MENRRASVRISLAELSIALKRQGILSPDEFPKRITPSLKKAQQSVNIELWKEERYARDKV